MRRRRLALKSKMHCLLLREILAPFVGEVMPLGKISQMYRLVAKKRGLKPMTPAYIVRLLIQPARFFYDNRIRTFRLIKEVGVGYRIFMDNEAWTRELPLMKIDYDLLQQRPDLLANQQSISEAITEQLSSDAHEACRRSRPVSRVAANRRCGEHAGKTRS